jgi:hypothetical protein
MAQTSRAKLGTAPLGTQIYPHEKVMKATLMHQKNICKTKKSFVLE